MNELAPGLPAVQVMSEYVRAVRLLGHPAPEPTRLHTAYTAEDGMDLAALDADARALSAAAATAEETLLLQEHARRTLDGTWRGAGAQAAADRLHRHADSAGALVEGLRGTAVALGDLGNRLRQLIDAKVDTTLEVEARGARAQWLGAARTVTTGAGDRSAASELVDLQVAPFVANDIGIDWVSSMRDTEAAIRQAYRDAATAAGSAAAVFERPGSFLSVGTGSPAAEQVWARTGPAAVTVPAGYAPAPQTPESLAAPASAPLAPAAPVMPSSAPPAAGPAPLDPAATVPPATPMPNGVGGGASPLGSGMTGLSGLGQSLTDMLGGLLGSGGDALGENLAGTHDLDLGPDDDPEDREIEDPAEGEVPDGEVPEDEVPKDDDSEEDDSEETEGEAEAGDPEEPDDAAPGEPAAAGEPASPSEPVAPQPEPPVPTPVPDPPVDPVIPAEPAPPETPCQIAADDLPQAGP